MTGRGGKFYDKAGDGQAEQYVQTVCSCAFQDHPKTQRMPISVQNKMPHVGFPVGLQDHQVSLIGLHDTGTANTTGLYSYYKQLCK